MGRVPEGGVVVVLVKLQKNSHSKLSKRSKFGSPDKPVFVGKAKAYVLISSWLRSHKYRTYRKLMTLLNPIADGWTDYERICNLNKADQAIN